MDSKPLAFLNDTFGDNNCACSVRIPADIELRIDPFYFVKFASYTPGTCDQKVWAQNMLRFDVDCSYYSLFVWRSKSNEKGTKQYIL